MLSRYAIIDTPQAPKVAAVSAKPITLIPVEPGNSPSSSFSSFTAFLLPCPLIFFISLLEAYVIFILKSITY